MNWLFHNPIGEMYGPTFLLVYALAIGVTLAVCYCAARLETAARSAVPALPADPDPYEIAYLRGGENEALRLAIFRLMRAGHVQAGGIRVKKLSSAAAPALASPDVCAIEAEVLTYLRVQQEVGEIFKSSLPARINALCVGYKAALHAEGLLNGPEAAERAQRVFLCGAVTVCGLGGYKLLAAVSSGHNNIAFLILMAVISLPLLGMACRPARLSRLGQRYLERLQTAFSGTKSRLSDSEAGDANASLALALFGAGVLAATTYAEFPQVFQRAANTGSCGGGCGSGSVSSCGASCGGGGCGGGGCGGGGCGGGGCGGCGGG